MHDQRKDESLQLLARATDLLANCMDYEATLETVASLLVSSLATWCVIDLVTEDGKVERAAVKHRDSASKADLARKILLYYSARPSATRGVYHVIATRKSVLIPHTPESAWAKRADDPEHLRLILDLGSSSYMCVPLIARGRVVGAIILLSGERTYDESDLRTAEEFARCIAMAVDNVHMFRKMQAALKELNATQTQLIQTAKMAALGTISAGIAHEINNPLSIIRAYLEHIDSLPDANDVLAKEKFRGAIGKINNNIDRIATIVRNVKDFSRPSRQAFSPVDLNGLVRSSLAFFKDQFPLEHIKIETALPGQSVFIHGNPTRLEQVMLNVLTNAKDAIEAGGRGKGGTIRIQVDAAGGMARIQVSDDGAGIPIDLRDRVFDPFFTTKEVGQGTGLGLSISHGIVRDHGGTIEILASESVGTTIAIRLPIVANTLTSKRSETALETTP